MKHRWAVSVAALGWALGSTSLARAQDGTEPFEYELATWPPGQGPSPPPGQWQGGPYATPPPGQAPYGSGYGDSPGYAYQQTPYQHPPPTEPWEAPGDRWDAGAGGWILLGLRGSRLAVSGSDADATSYGMQLVGGVDGTFTGDIFSFRGLSFAGLGGSSESLEGFTEGMASFGVRGYFGEHHGPFARLGYGWEAMGNDKTFLWYIELPGAQAGYQIFTEDLVLELGGRGSVMLGGGYYTGDEAERDFKTSLAWGGVGLLAVTPVALSGEYIRIEARQTAPETPVDIASARLCAGYIFAGCADLKHIRADVSFPDGSIHDATSFYLGISLGVGIAGAIGE